MTRRQSIARQWLIVSGTLEREAQASLRRLPRGAGVLLLHRLDKAEARRIRNLATLRGLTVVPEATGAAARVHNLTELRAALLRRTPIILLSPMFETPTHPDWQPLSRMRAATLARLARRNTLALGGMNERRYATIASLGFIGWAGISAFRT